MQPISRFSKLSPVSKTQTRFVAGPSEHVKSGDLTAAEGKPLIAAVAQMKQLTPAQRDSIATVLTMETAARP